MEGQAISTEKRLEAAAGDELRLCLRPEALSLDGAGANRLKGRVENVKLHGSIVRLVVRIGKSEVFMDGFNDPGLRLPSIGEEVLLAFSPESCSVARPEAAPVPADAIGDETEGRA